MTLNLIILGILIALSAFFSASEVAFISLSEAKVDSLIKQGHPKAHIIKKLMSNPRKLLVTILIGNNIVNIASASLATIVASDIFESAVLGVTTGVMTLLVLIFGEILPKSYAANHPKRFALIASRPVAMLQFIGRPVIAIFELLTNLFAGEQQDQRISEEELKAMAFTSVRQGSIDKAEGQMIERLFQFNDILAEDIMTPRVDITYIQEKMSAEEAIDIINTNTFTRYPVIRETPDDIIGFIHARDLLLPTHKNIGSLAPLIRPIIHVPRQLPIDALLKEYQKTQTHMAVVMDEHGGTEGIATLEDVIEELVGEIADEHDVEEDDIIKRIDKRTILASGDTSIREINHFANIRLPGDPLDTIAELIISHTKSVPRKGMTVTFDDIECVIEGTKKKVIQMVRITKPE